MNIKKSLASGDEACRHLDAIKIARVSARWELEPVIHESCLGLQHNEGHQKAFSLCHLSCHLDVSDNACY